MTDESGLVAEAMIVRMAERLRLLGQPVRLRLVELLSQGPSTPQALSDALGLSQQNVSKHLLGLYRAGMVSRRAEGANVIYALTDENAREIMDLTLESVARHAQKLADLASGNIVDRSGAGGSASS